MNIRKSGIIVMMGATLCAPLCQVARPAYLEDQTGTPSVREFVPPHRIPAPLPQDDTPLHRLLQRVDIGRPTHSGGVSVFPLLLRDSGDTPDIRTLDEALNRGWITIREQDQARVSEVVVRNDSKYPVFLMAGEILGGGRQDRIIRSDVLLRPGWESVTVPVYCGEQDRWKGARESFDSAPHLAGQALRGMAARAASQEAIWGEIDHRIKDSGIAAPTRSYQSLYNDPDTRRRLDTFADCFHGLRTRRTIGLVILHAGHVVSADLFGDPALCARLWDKIIRSHAAEGFFRESKRPEAERLIDASGMRVRQFLDDLARSETVRESTPGAGQSFSLGGSVEGHLLVWNDRLVHAAAFPTVEWRPRPPRPGPIPIPLRVDR
jgi:hypothetical protein